MDKYEIFLAFGILILVIYFFIKISLKIRKSGGTMTTTMHGALDAFYDKNKKNAVEVVVEKQAHKKLEEQSSAEPEQDKR